VVAAIGLLPRLGGPPSVGYGGFLGAAHVVDMIIRLQSWTDKKPLDRSRWAEAVGQKPLGRGRKRAEGDGKSELPPWV
jgi:hypothetical protein